MSSTSLTEDIKNDSVLLAYDCEQCLHGGKCRTTALSEVSCLCQTGYEGTRCQQSVIDFVSSQKEWQNANVIIGIVVAVFAFIVLVVAGILLWRRTRNHRRKITRNPSPREAFQNKVLMEGRSITESRPSQSKENRAVTPPFEDQTRAIADISKVHSNETLPVLDCSEHRHSSVVHGCLHKCQVNAVSAIFEQETHCR